jgi:hypothetical protein
MNKAKEYWRTIIHSPWRMDDWVFWGVLVIMGVLCSVIIYLGVVYTKSVVL